MTLSQGVILQFGGWVPLNFTAYSKQQAFPVTSSSQTSPFCQLPGQDLTLKMQSQNQELRQQMRLQQGFTSQKTLSNCENPANGVTTGGRWGFHFHRLHWQTPWLSRIYLLLHLLKSIDQNQTNQFCALCQGSSLIPSTEFSAGWSRIARTFLSETRSLWTWRGKTWPWHFTFDQSTWNV